MFPTNTSSEIDEIFEKKVEKNALATGQRSIISFKCDYENIYFNYIGQDILVIKRFFFSFYGGHLIHVYKHIRIFTTRPYRAWIIET